MYDRDRVLDAIDLPALADELLGPRTGTGRSPTWPCPDPNHAQTGRTPPVTTFRSRTGVERWHCHGCGAGGTAIDLVLAATTLDIRGAIEALAARAGVHDQVGSLQPRRRPAPASSVTEEPLSDPDGLRAYVEECAQRLWSPDGKPALRWLTDVRHLPAEVLRANTIGADPGRRRQSRPAGMPAAGWAVVLPVIEEGQPVFAQLRLLTSRSGPRYLNASGALAPNPRVGTYRPAEERGSCTIITEGILDALSAATAGYRSAAILGAALPEATDTSPTARALVTRLARLPPPVATALDADAAGTRATQRLHQLLAAHHVTATRLHLPAGVKDLNEWMQHAADWPRALESELRTAFARAPRPSIALGR